MSDTETNVKIGAQTDELNAGMATAEATVDKAALSIQGSMAKMSEQVVGSVKSMQQQVQTHFDQIGATVNKVMGVMATIGMVVAGGKMFKDVIGETVKWTGEAVKLSKSLGITTEAASILNIALDDTFNSMETMLNGANMVTRTLKTNEEAFSKLGVETRDVNGNYRATGDIMGDVNAKLNTLKEGTDRNVAGMMIYGRQWNEVRGLLRINADVMKEAEQRAKELHLIVGPEGVAMSKAYRMGMKDIEDVLQSVKVQIGNAVLPALIQLGAWFNSIGPQSIEMFKGALNGIVTFCQFVGLGVITLYETVKAAFQQIITGALTVGEVMKKVMAGDFAGAAQAATAGWQEMQNIGEAAFNRIAVAANKTNDSVMKLWGLKPTNLKASSAGPDERFDAAAGAGDGKDSSKADKSRVSDWKSDLEQMKEDSGNFFKDSKQEELEYWTTILNRADLSKEEQRQVRHELFQLKSAIAHEELAVELTNLKAQSDGALAGSQQRINIAKQEAELIKSKYGEQSKEYSAMLREVEKMQKEHQADQIKRADLVLDKEREIASIKISMERDRIANLKSLGAISDSQEIAAITKLTQQEQALEIQALQQKLMLARQGSVEEQQINLQLEVTQQKHLQTMQKLNMQAANAQSAPWRSLGTSIASSFGQAINNMIAYGTKFGTVMKNLSRAILGNFINMAIQMGMEWVKQQVMMLLFGKATDAAMLASKASAAAASQAITSTSNVAEATSETGVAAIGAASAVASIPYVGPILAAAAYAEMMALGAGAIGMAAAAGGYDVPAGVNPVTQLHQNEMVLPSHLADKVRNMTDAPQQALAVNFNVTAIDAKSVKKFLNDHGSKIADSLQSQLRNFRPVKA